MLRPMHSAACSARWQPLSLPRVSRELLGVGLIAWSSACSVYSSDLMEGTSAGVAASGGDDRGAAPSTGSSGRHNGAGGSSSNIDVPGVGGEPNESDAGSAGTSVVPIAGGSGTPGGSGSTAGGGMAPGTNGGTTGNAGGAGGGAGSGPVAGTADLLDGFEDEDLTLEQTSGRGGVWYPFDDGTVGKAGPVPLVCSPLSAAPAALGGYGMHITATGFTGWGSGLGVDFRAGKKVYDASKFSGIRFWARVGDAKNTHHRVQLADATTDKAGGKCNVAVNAPDGEKCDDHFGINETFTTSWAQYVIGFDQLTQIGWGNPAPALDKAALFGLQITAKAKLEVDLWLDQIEFF
jgi:hypothetical protein